MGKADPHHHGMQPDKLSSNPTGAGNRHEGGTSPGGERTAADSPARRSFESARPRCSFRGPADVFEIGVELWASSLPCFLLPRWLGQVCLSLHTVQNGYEERIQAETECTAGDAPTVRHDRPVEPAFASRQSVETDLTAPLSDPTIAPREGAASNRGTSPSDGRLFLACRQGTQVNRRLSPSTLLRRSRATELTPSRSSGQGATTVVAQSVHPRSAAPLKHSEQRP